MQRSIGLRRSVMAALAGLLVQDKKDARDLTIKLDVPDTRFLKRMVEMISPIEHYRAWRNSWSRRGWSDFRANGPGEVARRQRHMDRGLLAFHYVGKGAEHCLHPYLKMERWDAIRRNGTDTEILETATRMFAKHGPSLRKLAQA